MRGLLVSSVWTLAGAAVAAALFWGFLNTPESTVFTLALSAVLVLAMYAVLAATVAGALTGWQDGWRALPMAAAARGVVTCLPAVVVVLAMWWVVGQWLSWLTAHSGEISAWFIATLNWADVQPLLRGVEGASQWLRWVVVPFAALVWLGDALAGNWRPSRRSASPVRLALVTAIAAATVWAPLTYLIYWKPPGLPPTWVEPVFAVAKFAAMAFLGAMGWSLITRLAAPAAPAARAPDGT